MPTENIFCKAWQGKHKSNVKSSLYSNVYTIYQKRLSILAPKIFKTFFQKFSKVFEELKMSLFNPVNPCTKLRIIGLTSIMPVSIYLLKVNYRNNRTRWEICSKFKIKTPERRLWLYCKLSTYFTPCSSASIANFEHAIAGWDGNTFVFSNFGHTFSNLMVLQKK